MLPCKEAWQQLPYVTAWCLREGLLPEGMRPKRSGVPRISSRVETTASRRRGSAQGGNRHRSLCANTFLRNACGIAPAPLLGMAAKWIFIRDQDLKISICRTCCNPLSTQPPPRSLPASGNYDTYCMFDPCLYSGEVNVRRTCPSFFSLGLCQLHGTDGRNAWQWDRHRMREDTCGREMGSRTLG